MGLEPIFSAPITINGLEDRLGYYPERNTYTMPYKNKQDLYRNQVARWIQRKKDAIQYLGGACIKCGYNKCYAALEFHHRNPSNKDVSWTKLRLRSWDKVLKELDKCDLLCANCHREHHHELSC